jgi:hypothetical protein
MGPNAPGDRSSAYAPRCPCAQVPMRPWWPHRLQHRRAGRVHQRAPQPVARPRVARQPGQGRGQAQVVPRVRLGCGAPLRARHLPVLVHLVEVLAGGWRLVDWRLADWRVEVGDRSARPPRRPAPPGRPNGKPPGRSHGPLPAPHARPLPPTGRSLPPSLPPPSPPPTHPTPHSPPTHQAARDVRRPVRHQPQRLAGAEHHVVHKQHLAGGRGVGGGWVGVEGGGEGWGWGWG